MITVKVSKKADYIHSFAVSGHAESGPYGHDLVCSAVSAIVFGSINAVFSLTEMKLNIDQGDGGYIKVTIPSNATEATKEKTELLLRGMIVSLETVERDYGQYITIKK